MKRLMILVIAIVCCAWDTFATRQQPDVIIYNGKSYDLLTNPLEFYFGKNHDKRPKTEIINSSLWRGYIATFQVIDKQVYLVKLEIEVDAGKRKSVIEEVFAGQKNVLMDWLSGVLVLPIGEPVKYALSPNPEYENYLLLELDNGNVTKFKEMNMDQYSVFVNQQVELFKKTEEYLTIYKSLSENDRSQESIDSFLKIHIRDKMKGL